MNLVRIAIISFCLLGAPVVSGCGSPCGNLWKRLEGCAKTETDRGIYKSKNMKRAFLARCRKADKSRLKQCLKLKDCNKLRRCATRMSNKFK